MTLVAATPILASLDITRTVAFYADQLGFEVVHAEPGVYGIVRQGPVSIHFWACNDPKIAQATACRIQVQGIERLYAACCDRQIVHPNAPLAAKPWGGQEFAILDPDGNLVTFHQAEGAAPSPAG